MATILTPPTPLPPMARKTVFLAGSIDMGRAEPWQDRAAAMLSDLDIDILNPRRDAWDSTWTQSLDFPPFREQVEWELAGLERASVIAMHFAPESQAPITLLELGLVARTGRAIVCCPHGYWRKGNVDVVCTRYGVAQAATLEDLIVAVRAKLAT